MDTDKKALINSKRPWHPSGVLPHLLQVPGVSLRSTPGYVSLNPLGSINQWFLKNRTRSEAPRDYPRSSAFIRGSSHFPAQ